MTPRAYFLLGTLLALLTAWIFEDMPFMIPVSGFMFFCGIAIYFVKATEEEFWDMYLGRDR